MTLHEIFFWVLIPVAFVGGLVIVGGLYELFARRDWLRRLRSLERGRRAMGENR